MPALDAAAARERFAAERVARLATLTGSGAPHVIPIVFATDAEGSTVYSAVDAKPKRTTALARLAHVAADPRICLLADHYEEDWSALWWVRGDGTARVLPDGNAECVRARQLLAARYPQQQVTGAVLACDVSRWSGWAASAGGSD